MNASEQDLEIPVLGYSFLFDYVIISLDHLLCKSVVRLTRKIWTEKCKQIICQVQMKTAVVSALRELAEKITFPSASKNIALSTIP